MTEKIHACPTCGPTATEPHPRLPVDRCSNCKERITPGPARTTMGDGAGCAACGGTGACNGGPCPLIPGSGGGTPGPVRKAKLEGPMADVQFGSPDCTCIPWTRQDGAPRYCGPHDTVDMIGGWERGRDCPHHAPAPEPGLREHAAVTLTVTVRASTTVEAEHWAHTIRDLAVAEYGQTMRLETSLSAGTPAVRDAELQQLREELQRLREESPWLRATAEDLADAQATIARVRALAERWDRDAPPPGNRPLTELHAALDQPQEQP